ncbi:MAG TPA: AbrB family transcriptional regulator [Hyphomicrobiales bacterium]|nr:AbrB family transcriptional regulator [Hyphomicrobiales bacterium]
MKLEIKKIGNSTGLILPKELMARLKLEQGDWLFVSETADGGVRLTPFDPELERGMESARKVMKRYRNALAELAK